MKIVLFIILPVSAFLVLNKNLFSDNNTTDFILNGKVLFPLGLAAAACNMIGGYPGAGLAITKGGKIVRPSILIVLFLLLLKILREI